MSVDLRMLQRRGTTTEWFDANPVLGQGEWGIEFDDSDATVIIGAKVGDGITAWNDRDYFAAGGGGGGGGVTSVNGDTGPIVVLTKSDLGLGSVDNTADTAKPVSTAQQTALDLKANLASPALTGNPTAPTPTAGDSDTSIATTAFVTAADTAASTADRARANHTGTQTLSTISDAGTAAAANTGTSAGNVPTVAQADARYDAIGASAAAQAASQPLDSDLTAIAALTTTSFGRALLALADAAAGRTALALGTAATADTGTTGGQVLTRTGADGLYQPLDSDLTALAALTTTAYGRSLLEAVNAAALRTLAGTVIGTDVQAYDAELAAIAALTSAANKLPYFTGSGTAALADLTAAGRALLDDADATAQRTTLGLGTAATSNTGDFDAAGAAAAAQAASQPLDADLTDLATNYTKASASGPAQLALLEDTDNGTNKIAVVAPASIASDKTATLPDLTGNIIVAAGTAAQGDVLYHNGTDWVRLAAGTSGLFLKTNGAGANPAWATPAADFSFYRNVWMSSGRGSTSASSASKYFLGPQTSDSSAPGAGAAGANVGMLYWPLVAADMDVSGLTTKMRITAQIYPGTAPAVTITLGLYPVTAGANLSLGTVVTGSTVAFASPSGNAITTGNSGDFDLPSDGNYALGYVVSGTPSGNFVIQGQIQVRNV